MSEQVFVDSVEYRTLVAEHARLRMALEVIGLDMKVDASTPTHIRRLTARLALGLPEESAPRPEVVAAELAELRVEIMGSAQELRESIADLEASFAEPEPEPEPNPPVALAKPKLPPSKGSRDGLSERSQQALEIIRSAREIRPGDLYTRLGVEKDAGRRAVVSLVERGLVLEEGGGPRDRVYKAPPRGPGYDRVKGKPLIPPKRPEAPPPPTQQKVTANGNGGGSIEGRVMEAALYRGGTISEIAHRLELGVDEVGAALRKMEREGEVRSRSVDGQLVWGSP